MFTFFPRSFDLNMNDRKICILDGDQGLGDAGNQTTL